MYHCNAILLQYLRRYLNGSYRLCCYYPYHRRGKREENQCIDVCTGNPVHLKIHFSIIFKFSKACLKNYGAVAPKTALPYGRDSCIAWNHCYIFITSVGPDLWYKEQTTCVLRLNFRTFMETPFALNSLPLRQRARWRVRSQVS